MRIPSRIQEVLRVLEETHRPEERISSSIAELLFVLIRLKEPARIIDIGTGSGYAAIVLGAAAQAYGGEVVTIERSGECVDRARQSILRAGLQDVVTVHPGSAHKVLKRLHAPYACVFIDGTAQEYAGYLHHVMPLLSSPAMLFAADVLGDEKELLPFLEAVMTDRRFTSSIVPLGFGLLFAVYDGARQVHAARMAPMHDLVIHTAARIFRGTSTDVQTGDIFRSKDGRADVVDRTFDGYDASLAEEALRLPPEA